MGDKQASDGYYILQELRADDSVVDHKSLYIYQKYKVQFRAPQPYNQETNLLKRLHQVLVNSFNNAKLPRHLIVMLDEAIVEYSEAADTILSWVVKEIWRLVEQRTSELPIQAKPMFNTQILFIKPVSKPVWADPDRSFMHKKRTINHELDRIVKGYKNTAAMNIDTIQPDIDSLYNHRLGSTKI